MSASLPCGPTAPGLGLRAGIGSLDVSSNPDQPPSLKVTFRRPLLTLLYVVALSVVPGVIFLSGVMVTSTHGLEKAGNGVAVLVCVALGIRLAGLGVVADDDRIVVRNIFRTHRIRWPEITRFEEEQQVFLRKGPRIHLIDGRFVAVTIYAKGETEGRPARRLIQELATRWRQLVGVQRTEHPADERQ